MVADINISNRKSDALRHLRGTYVKLAFTEELLRGNLYYTSKIN